MKKEDKHIESNREAQARFKERQRNNGYNQYQYWLTPRERSEVDKLLAVMREDQKDGE